MKRPTAFSSEGGFSSSHFLNSYFQKHTWLIVSLILAMGILLRLPHLNRSLWYDELWSTSIKLKNLVSLGVTALLDPHPPFYVVFMYLWISIFGDSEISIRIPPLIFGTLSIVLVYYLALKFLEKNASLLAAFLMCISPVHIWYSREARPYSATLFLLLASILSYYKLLDSRASSRVWYLIYFMSLCFAVFSHYYIIVFIALISVIALSQPNVLRNRLLIANVLILVLFTLFIGIKLTVGRFLTGSGYLRPFTVQELFALFFNWFLTGNSLWNNIDSYRFDLNIFLQRTVKYCIQIIFLFIFVKGIISIIKSKGQPPQIHLILYQFSLPFFLFMLTLIGFKDIYIERSLLVVLPFYYLILIKGLTDFKNGSTMAVAIIAVLLFKVVTLSLFFIKMTNGRFTNQTRTGVPLLTTFVKN